MTSVDLLTLKAEFSSGCVFQCMLFGLVVSKVLQALV